MAEYIDREAMLEQIARRESLMAGDKMISIDALRAFIMNRPVADVDAVPVIRCEDCKWYGRDKQKGGFCRKPDASMWSPGLPIDELKPDDYCSRAKRKENSNGN